MRAAIGLTLLLIAAGRAGAVTFNHALCELNGQLFEGSSRARHACRSLALKGVSASDLLRWPDGTRRIDDSRQNLQALVSWVVRAAVLESRLPVEHLDLTQPDHVRPFEELLTEQRLAIARTIVELEAEANVKAALLYSLSGSLPKDRYFAALLDVGGPVAFSLFIEDGLQADRVDSRGAAQRTLLSLSDERRLSTLAALETALSAAAQDVDRREKQTKDEYERQKADVTARLESFRKSLAPLKTNIPAIIEIFNDRTAARLKALDDERLKASADHAAAIAAFPGRRKALSDNLGAVRGRLADIDQLAQSSRTRQLQELSNDQARSREGYDARRADVDKRIAAMNEKNAASRAALKKIQDSISSTKR